MTTILELCWVPWDTITNSQDSVNVKNSTETAIFGTHRTSYEQLAQGSSQFQH